MVRVLMLMPIQPTLGAASLRGTFQVS